MISRKKKTENKAGYQPIDNKLPKGKEPNEKDPFEAILSKYE